VKSSLHLIIHGDVQGVFFRAGTQSEARKLGVSGWVKNNPDGSVEVMAEGDPQKLQALLVWCKKGPGGAAVERVEETWGVAAGELQGFEVR
jgi:acylphosphatase